MEIELCVNASPTVASSLNGLGISPRARLLIARGSMAVMVVSFVACVALLAAMPAARAAPPPQLVNRVEAIQHGIAEQRALYLSAAEATAPTEAPEAVVAQPARAEVDAEPELSPLPRSHPKAAAPARVASSAKSTQPKAAPVAPRPVRQASASAKPHDPRSSKFSDEPADPDSELKRPSLD